MCDTLCVRTRDGMLFAKNSDRHPDEVQVVEWHDARRARGELHTQYLTVPDADAFGFCGSRPEWLWGAEHGVNEHGVAIGNEKIWTVDRPRAEPPALLGMDLVRLGLERARTADDALDVITALVERYGQAGSGEPHEVEPYFSSFLIVDGRGGWVVETSDRVWAARPVHDAAAISNRVELRTEWTRASAELAPGDDFEARYRHPQMPTEHADRRLATTRACVAGPAGHAGPAAIASVLRSHGAPGAPPPRETGADWSGFTVCLHRPEWHAQTTASMIALLPDDGPPRMWAALGNPCVSVYVPAFPGAAAPELGDPEQWRRFARLRGRIEARPEELAAVRAELDPVEQALWADADAVATNTRGARAFAAGAYAPVDAALHRLGV